MTKSRYQNALLSIGSQHPAWSADPNDNLVRIFNAVTKEAREVLGAVGPDDNAKAEWCVEQLDNQRLTKLLKRKRFTQEDKAFLERKHQDAVAAVEAETDAAKKEELRQKSFDIRRSGTSCNKSWMIGVPTTTDRRGCNGRHSVPH